MSRKFTEILTPSQLAAKIIDAAQKHPDFYPNKEDHDEHVSPNKPLEFINQHEYSFTQIIKSLTPTIYKDLNKIEFDTENVNLQENKKQRLGFYTLPNQLTVLGVQAGGDWECPVYFILYFDGKKLRAYIPTEGNTWNTKTKQAYGNNDQADKENVKQIFNIDVKDGYSVSECVDLEFDFDKIEQDIIKRITQ